MEKQAAMTSETKLLHFHIPDDAALMAAIGRVSVLHSRLDYVLRLTIKTLSGMEFNKAMDATQNETSSGLRQRVNKWGERVLGESEALIELQAYVKRCERVSRQRNELLHSLYAKELDGEPVILDRDRKQKPIPTVPELRTIENELQTLCDEMNAARFDGGFLVEVVGV
jgi:hypothetical protein